MILPRSLLLGGYAASCAACAVLGWELRDRSADLAQATAQRHAQAARADAAQAALQQDRGNHRAGTASETRYLAAQAAHARRFTTIERDIQTHAQNTHRDRGDADPEFVRIWREANTGGAPSP